MSSDSSTTRIDCEKTRLELPAMLYNELEADLKTRVEQHLESCAACRAELDGHRRTMRALDEWAAPTIPGASGGPRRRRILGRIRPVLIGTAAALIVFALGALVGTNARYENGRLTVSLGRDAATDLAAMTSNLRAVVGQELDTRIDALLEALETDLDGLRHDEQQRRILLAQTVDLRRDDDWRRLALIVDALVERQDAEALRVSRFENELAAHRNAASPDIPNPGAKPNKKEKS